MVESTGRTKSISVANERVRSSSRFVAEKVGGRIVELPRGGRAAGGLRAANGFHACRAVAGVRARFLSLVVLPGLRILFSHEPLRDLRRFSISGQHASRGGHRRADRLGAGAFSAR